MKLKTKDLMIETAIDALTDNFVGHITGFDGQGDTPLYQQIFRVKRQLLVIEREECTGLNEYIAEVEKACTSIMKLVVQILAVEMTFQRDFSTGKLTKVSTESFHAQKNVIPKVVQKEAKQVVSDIRRMQEKVMMMKVPKIDIQQGAQARDLYLYADDGKEIHTPYWDGKHTFKKGEQV